MHTNLFICIEFSYDIKVAFLHSNCRFLPQMAAVNLDIAMEEAECTPLLLVRFYCNVHFRFPMPVANTGSKVGGAHSIPMGAVAP